jgi:hypothetical protein
MKGRFKAEDFMRHLVSSHSIMSSGSASSPKGTEAIGSTSLPIGPRLFQAKLAFQFLEQVLGNGTHGVHRPDPQQAIVLVQSRDLTRVHLPPDPT